MKIKFTVDGEPKGKQRPRFNPYSKKPYTPDDTKQHEQLTAWAYKAQCGYSRFPAGTYIDMRIIAYMSIPKKTSQADRKLMLEGKIRPTKKPDCDNIFKLVADALNGIAYSDDKFIVDAQVRKFYSDEPRTEIIMIGDLPNNNH